MANMPTAIAVLGRSTEMEMRVQSALQALLEIAATEDGEGQLQDAGALHAVAACLSVHRERPQVCSRALHLLRTLVRAAAKAESDLKTEEICTPVVALMGLYAKDQVELVLVRPRLTAPLVAFKAIRAASPTPMHA